MFMKKLMMIAAMMVAALTASAQNDDLKNEFGVGEKGIITVGLRYKW